MTYLLKLTSVLEIHCNLLYYVSFIDDSWYGLNTDLIRGEYGAYPAEF